MSAEGFVFSTLIARHSDPAKASRALQLAEAAVLRRAADAISALPQHYEYDPGRGDAVARLRSTAVGIEEKATAPAATATPELLPKTDVVAWLTKKAREYRSAGGPVRAAQADAIGALASKVERGAVRPGNLQMLPESDATDPLIVDRFDTAMEPAPEDPPVLIVGAIAADGTPVALFFDAEARAKVGGWLIPHTVEEKSSRDAANATPTDAQRRARLLHEIALGGRWKSGGVVRWYRANGFNLGVRSARFDLAALRDAGDLVEHHEKGVRYFTASQKGRG